MSPVPVDAPNLRTFGPLVGAMNVRAAALSTLADGHHGVSPYLEEIERLNGLENGSLERPPSPSSFRGGIDWNTYQGDTFPLLVVIVQPFGQPERYGAGEYGQWFAVQVGAMVRVDTEENAITTAECYGVAVCGSILQYGGLGLPNVVKTVLYDFPMTTFPDETGTRNMVRATSTFHTFLQPVFAERYAPPPASSPYPPTYPTATNVEVTLAGEPLAPGGPTQTSSTATAVAPNPPSQPVGSGD